MIKIVSRLALLLALLCHPLPSFAEDYMSEVARANELYANNKYQEAVDSYETIIQKDFRNGHLFYNLGNSYIRLGKIGPAILNYIRAQKLIPRDENLQANLNFAIQQTRDKISLPQPNALGTLFFWVNDLNLSENIKLAFYVNLSFWLILAAWFYFRSNLLKLARNSVLYLLLVAFIAIGVKLHLESDSKMGVVLEKKVAVKSGLDLSNVTLFELHEGALVTITDEHRDWVEIRLDPKQKGWVPKSSIGI